MEIANDRILHEVGEKINEAKKEKVRILGMDKNHPALPSVDARINSLVLIKSELIKENKNNNEYHLTRSEETIFLNKMAETRKQNVKDYSDNGRPELAEAEYQELQIINEFLPKMPSEEEIKEFISQKIDEFIISQEDGHTLSMKDMGKIKTLINETYPTVTGGIIKDVLMSKIKN